MTYPEKVLVLLVVVAAVVFALTILCVQKAREGKPVLMEMKR